MPPLPPQEGQPDALEVLAAIMEQDAADVPNLDRLTIFQATPTQYAYRVYQPGDADYDGGVITVTPSP